MPEAIQKSCIELGVVYMIMPSGAGHDAKEIAKSIPRGMVFIPSQGGKSHCKEEFAEWTHL